MSEKKQLFKKAAVFTDIHYGMKSNSVLHNSDCDAFIDWFIDLSKKEGCETCLFLGDFHHNRSHINILTLQFILRALEKLTNAFEMVYFLPGNHDLYYKDRRDVQSAIWAKHLPNIKIIDEWFEEGDVTIVPWLIGDDYKKVRNIKTKYVFGHFEIPHFFMNAMITMPDHGELKQEDFSDKIEYVFSGHFHKRQVQRNINYIGNCFPHNYADADDNERGCMILEWDKEPKYYNWEDGPSYKVVNLSELLESADDILKPKMHLRVNIDINISYEEATFIKENFVDQYQLREITLMPQKNQDVQDGSAVNLTYESVDQIVTAELLNIESDTYNSQILLTIYEDL